MCGIFGYVGSGNGSKLSPHVLRCIAAHTEQARGGHAIGLAWVTAEGRTRHWKAAGKLTGASEVIESLATARAVLGHTRYATHGSTTNNYNNHPFACDGGWLVHNGVIMGHRDIASKRGLHLSSDCDSEVLAAIVETADGDRIDRVLDAVNTCHTGPLATAVLWPEELVIGRLGNPLSYCATKDGSIYFASLGSHLPGTPVDFPDRTVLSVHATNGQVVIAGEPVKPGRLRKATMPVARVAKFDPGSARTATYDRNGRYSTYHHYDGYKWDNGVLRKATEDDERDYGIPSATK